MPDIDPAGPSHRPRLRTAAASGLLALTIGTTALSVLPGGGHTQTTAQTKGTAGALSRAPDSRADFAELAAPVTPAVVGMTVAGRAPAAQTADLPPELCGTPMEEFFRRFGGGQGQQQPRGRGATGKGSGFIIDLQGFVALPLAAAG